MLNFEQLQQQYNEMYGEGSKGPKYKQNNQEFLKKFCQLRIDNVVRKEFPVRLLESMNADGDPVLYTQTARHEVKDQKGFTRQYHCRRAVLQEDCPICNFLYTIRSEIWAEDGTVLNEELKKFYNKVKAKPRFYLNVLDREVQKDSPDECVKILSTGPALHQKIMEALLNKELVVEEKGEIINILHPQKGRDFVICQNEGNGPKWYDASHAAYSQSPIAANKSEIEAILAQRHDISSMPKEESLETLEQAVLVLRGQVPENPDEDYAETAKKAKSNKLLEKLQS